MAKTPANANRRCGPGVEVDARRLLQFDKVKLTQNLWSYQA